jgi:hypothetical protein
MIILKLYAELVSNPQSLAAYHALIEKYKSCNMTNEATAIEDLIKKRFNADSSHSDQEQRKNNTKHS